MTQTTEDILRDLVAIPTVTGNYETSDQALDYIANFLSARGMIIQQYNINGYQSFVASTRRDNHKTPTVMLAAHVDVVPALEEMFKLRVDGDRLGGRGVFDMKYAIAVYMQLVDSLNGQLANYDFGIMITSDEEFGGFNGTKALLDKGYKPSIVILPDAGDSPDAWKFERSAKGINILKIQTAGLNAHGSRPWEGDNAIEKLILLLQDIKSLFEGQGPATNTLNIGVIEGGAKYNLVPGRASAILDIRILNDKEYTRLRKKIADICKKYEAELSDVVPYGTAFHTDFKNPSIDQFITCLKAEIKDTKLNVADSPGSSDARFFPPLNIPCIVISPPGDGYHATKEWVSKKGLQQLTNTLKHYLDEVAKH